MARKNTSGVPYLRYHKAKGTWLYSLPGGQERSLGKDRSIAIRLAREANRERERQEAQAHANAALAALRGDVDEDVHAFLIRWAEEEAPRMISKKTKTTLSPEALRSYRSSALLAANGSDQYEPLANQSIRWVRVADINNWLKQFPSVQANRHRSALSVAWKHAVREGLADFNAVRDADRREELLRRADDTVAACRDRLTLKDYLRIRDHQETPEWLRTAMELSLGLGLRLGDVQSLRWDQLSDDGKVLRVTPSKTQRTSGVTVVYHLGERVRQVFKAARDDIATPYVVHRIPIRKVRGRDRDHWTQLSKEQISKGFAGARKAARIRHQKDRAPQTYHEIRSLAAELYEQQLGAEAKAEVLELRTAALSGAQAALGHTGSQMTGRYLSRAGREIHVHADIDW